MKAKSYWLFLGAVVAVVGILSLAYAMWIDLNPQLPSQYANVMKGDTGSGIMHVELLRKVGWVKVQGGPVRLGESSVVGVYFKQEEFGKVFTAHLDVKRIVGKKPLPVAGDAVKVNFVRVYPSKGNPYEFYLVEDWRLGQPLPEIVPMVVQN